MRLSSDQGQAGSLYQKTTQAWCWRKGWHSMRSTAPAQYLPKRKESHVEEDGYHSEWGAVNVNAHLMLSRLLDVRSKFVSAFGRNQQSSPITQAISLQTLFACYDMRLFCHSPDLSPTAILNGAACQYPLSLILPFSCLSTFSLNLD